MQCFFVPTVCVSDIRVRMQARLRARQARAHDNDDPVGCGEGQPQAADLAGQQEHRDVARLEALHPRLRFGKNRLPLVLLHATMASYASPSS